MDKGGLDTIWVQYSRDSLAGRWADPEQVDLSASVEAYGEVLAGALRERYEDAEVRIESGTDVEITVDGERDHLAVAEVREVMARVREQRDWLRYTQQGVRAHLAEGLIAEREDGATASVREIKVDGARAYRLTRHKGTLSLEKEETFDSPDDLMSAMLDIASWDDWRHLNP